MCRLIAYKGAPIMMDQLIFQPKNSLIHQSYQAEELEEPLNGDGFGVGWYVPAIDRTPAVFVSTSPAWSNRNLRFIAPKISSPCIFAHVRAASVGDTSEANCHPFTFKQFMCMHNGNIGGFAAIKRLVRRSLSDEVYNWVRGQTDSEHFFALFLDRMLPMGDTYTPEDMRQAVLDTVRTIEKLRDDQGITEACYLNVVLGDGQTVVATRYISHGAEEDALSLYYSEGSRYLCEGGVCRMVQADPAQHAVLIVSEQLTDLRQDWKKIPVNHFVTVRPDMLVTLDKIVF